MIGGLLIGGAGQSEGDPVLVVLLHLLYSNVFASVCSRETQNVQVSMMV